MKAENQLSFPFGVQKLALHLESLELLKSALLPPLRLLFSPVDPPSEEDAAPPSLPPPTLEEVDRLPPPPPPPPPATRCRLLMVRRRSRPEGFL